MIYNVIESVIGHFPAEYKTMLEEISTVRHIDKEYTILEQGKYCNHLWFINKGAVKAFEWIEGNERVSHFFLDAKLAFALFFMQIVYKLLSPFTVKTIKHPFVISNIFIAVFHLLTIYTMIQADLLHFDILQK
ncbi:hypothetical protein SAMN00777080_4500 [Aquiflexum balticum DSM 16537]|uniref:Cyclic nucleotide-binding domain-containing protein n=1 Tax=Aquiflexum balticum DSM 16537 TaxID=758820 RepID=A0A1W2HAA8_9BACT|nr:hypothetical protein [Aquiflexum balticum]SMD45829.1 hypothetical protein SAMN00777080_4500 [Aquiflexum balticum DSM 16537]